MNYKKYKKYLLLLLISFFPLISFAGNLTNYGYYVSGVQDVYYSDTQDNVPFVSFQTAIDLHATTRIFTSIATSMPDSSHSYVLQLSNSDSGIDTGTAFNCDSDPVYIGNGYAGNEFTNFNCTGGSFPVAGGTDVYAYLIPQDTPALYQSQAVSNVNEIKPTFEVFDNSVPSGPATGCTYSMANNYDPSAVVDDGSCLYNLSVMFSTTTPVNVNIASTSVPLYNGANFQEWLFVAGVFLFFISYPVWGRLFEWVKELFTWW